MPLNAVGNVVLVVVDIQGGDPEAARADDHPQLPSMPGGRAERMNIAKKVLETCRKSGIPCVFIQEVHKPSLVDIGRELDGAEGPHCVEGWAETELASWIKPTTEEFLIRKRRYSAFFGTELEIVLKAYKAETLLLIGGFTDVCVHYTAVDAHQHDYRIRVLTDCCAGSSRRAHDYALEAMNYLQRDALVTSEDVFKYAAEKIAAKEDLHSWVKLDRMGDGDTLQETVI